VDHYQEIPTSASIPGIASKSLPGEVFVEGAEGSLGLGFEGVNKSPIKAYLANFSQEL
jgi:hypothetical protein